MARLVLLLRYGAVAWLLGALLVHADPGTALVGVAAAVAAALLLRLVLAVPALTSGTLSGPALRTRSASTATHPQRAPDAAGRPRPRAPAAGPLAA
jgi:hypothetical protein